MPESLLVTKYHRPDPPPDLVPRPQAMALFAAGLQGRLILVSAPAGFGKTTLVSAWLAHAAHSSQHAETTDIERATHMVRSAWLSLDADDNATPRFWAYVIAALQTTVPTVGLVAQAALQAPQSLPVESILTALINDLASLHEPLLLTLDDYHLITKPEIHSSLDMLLDHLPQTMRLVIISREDPPLGLARLRARGQLTEIRAADLRFSELEADELLNTVQALGLPGADVATLAARTEGWVTGLRLAALSLRQTNDRHGFVEAFGASHRFLTDYLVDEVLSRQPPHYKAFLLQTAVLDRLCGPLCDAVLGIAGEQDTADPALSATGRAYSQPILDEIDRANLFLVALDHERRWFRYHHLFAAFLRLRLRAAEPDLVAVLYQRAIAWCRAHGLPGEALGYALAAAAHDQAADLIEALAPDSLSREGPETVLTWVAALPDALVRQRPALCIQYAWALAFAGRMAEAADFLTAAETAAGTIDGLVPPQVAGQIAAHRAYLQFFRGEFAAAQRQAQQALMHLPANEHVLRVRTAVVLSSVLRFAGQLRAAEEALGSPPDAIHTTGNVYTAMLYYASLGEIHQERGRLHQALATFEQTLAFAVQHTGRADIPFTGFAHIAIGHVQREWNDLDTAATSISRGLALCRAWQQADALAIGLVELAQLHQDRGELDLAQQALADLRSIVATMASPWGAAIVALTQVRLDLVRGDLAAVDQWVWASGLTAADPVSAERIDALQTFGQALVARGNDADAVLLFDRLARHLRTTGQRDRLLVTLVGQARALAELGRRDMALAVLDEALRLGEPGGYVRVFVAGGPPVATLLHGMQHVGGRMQTYIARLLAAFGGGEAPPASSARLAAPTGETPLPEPLNERELAILRLMAAGLSNQAIGAELSLSVNTVRWYASQIFAKLRVSGRGAAVASGRHLGLL